MAAERRCICFGSSRALPGSEVALVARECGAVLAGLGWTVVTGGYEGAMGAVSRGARDAGGRVVGVTTSIFTERVPNDALHEEWTEPDYLARMAMLLRHGHAFLGLAGGLGTLSECLVATCLASIGQLGGPIVLFRNPWQPLFERVADLDEVGPGLHGLVHWIESADQLKVVPGPA